MDKGHAIYLGFLETIRAIFHIGAKKTKECQDVGGEIKVQHKKQKVVTNGNVSNSNRVKS